MTLAAMVRTGLWVGGASVAVACSGTSHTGQEIGYSPGDASLGGSTNQDGGGNFGSGNNQNNGSSGGGSSSSGGSSSGSSGASCAQNSDCASGCPSGETCCCEVSSSTCYTATSGSCPAVSDAAGE
jgi:hypothetical protein